MSRKFDFKLNSLIWYSLSAVGDAIPYSTENIKEVILTIQCCVYPNAVSNPVLGWWRTVFWEVLVILQVNSSRVFLRTLHFSVKIGTYGILYLFDQTIPNLLYNLCYIDSLVNT